MSFTAATRERRAPVVPLAGMIDIMFLLLVFFMTASVYRDQERQIDVSLPEAREGTSGDRMQIMITVQADDTIHMTGGVYTFETLAAKLAQLQRQFPDESVAIRGDRACRWGTIAKVITIAHSVGLYNVSFNTTKPASEL